MYKMNIVVLTQGDLKPNHRSLSLDKVSRKHISLTESEQRSCDVIAIKKDEKLKILKGNFCNEALQNFLFSKPVKITQPIEIKSISFEEASKDSNFELEYSFFSNSRSLMTCKEKKSLNQPLYEFLSFSPKLQSFTEL